MSEMNLLTSRNNDLTEKQRRGIDLVVKSASKKYPFILGWELFPDWQKYDAHLYLDLYVDWNLISQYYNEPINPYYVEYPEAIDKTSSLFTYLGSENNDRDEHIQTGYNHGVKVRNLFTTLYQALPEEYQLFYTHHGGLGDVKSLCSLTVNDYLNIKGKK